MASGAHRTRKFAAIDILRFVCAMLVVSYHVFSAYRLSPSPITRAVIYGPSIPASLVPWTWFGWIGVEIFFVISGYVIAASSHGRSAHGFLRSRALRLVPSVWICASTTAAALLASGQIDPQGIAVRWVNSTMFLPIAPRIDGSYWTLAIEVDFYLLITALMLCGWARSMDRIALALAVYSALFWVGSITGLIGVHSGNMENLLLLQHGCLFATGMALESRSRDASIMAQIALVVGVLASLIEIASHTVERAYAMHANFSLGTPVTIFLVGVTVVAAAHRIDAPSKLVRWSTMLGLMTYPLYLIHQDAGAVLISALMRLGFGYWAASAADICAVLAAAGACTIALEPWLRKLLADLIDRVRTRWARPSAMVEPA